MTKNADQDNRDIVVRVLNLMHVGNFYCQTEAVIFGADMSLSTHFDNEKKKKNLQRLHIRLHAKTNITY